MDNKVLSYKIACLKKRMLTCRNQDFKHVLRELDRLEMEYNKRMDTKRKWDDEPPYSYIRRLRESTPRTQPE